ncbi:sensor domain-containing diguanylate cyclase [Pseudidiomarina terrestris]|uniref:sensor domain-containing diguanylate cyclase n=1 Tax=Pseudidiomarina terrestris TaxID=2820060 RepID=UPI00264DB985|nr:MULTISPECIES: sensor domain-containing diguanylate cyclase [unclassified Pseudidiomarina]MDN7127946.1 GGDEF domain-containing protein [Pseudidiomarina sp. 1APR75-33.1]MDN7135606.1 GGDEF domain-containing protein [Pseudidiomarina sp. 1ASP75-5]
MPSQQQLLKVIKIQAEIAKQGMDLNGVMQCIVDETLALVDADAAVIELADGDELVYRAVSGTAAPYLGLRVRLDSSLSGLCVTSGEILICADSETDPRVDRVACRKIGLRSMIVIPIKHDNEIVGVLKAMSNKQDNFQQHDSALLGMLSNVVAATMHFSAEYGGDRLFYRATHDSMTGLANRKLFMDRLKSNVARIERNRKDFVGVLMIDMDGLKQINDTHGHRVGDALIIELANRLTKTIRETDTLARLGGDEFGVILTSPETPQALTTLISRIHSELEPIFTFNGESYQLKASIGSAILPEDGTEAHEVLEVADQRMYAVKHSRKN